MSEPQHVGFPPVEDRPIWDIWLSVNILPAVSAADEIGLFALLRDGPLSPPDIRQRLQIEERPAEALLAVLAALDLLRMVEGQVHLTPLSRTYLLRGERFYWGWMLGLNSPRTRQMVDVIRGTMHDSQDRWSRLAAGEQTAEGAARNAASMHSHSFPAALGMARHGDFSGVRRFLDIAGGSGCFSIALALEHPDIRCTVAELPVACEETRKYITQYGVQDRVDTLNLNMFQDPWPRDYDALFFSNVFHDWNASERDELARRAFEALPSGGRICLHEMLLNDAKDGPRLAALFTLLMLVGTRGKQFSAPELRELLGRVGFRDMRVQPTYGGYSLVTARKP